MGQQVKVPVVMPTAKSKPHEIHYKNYYFFWSIEKYYKYINSVKDERTKTW